MILIAGGAGYIGSHTNKLLSRRGIPTVVFDNLSLGHREFAKWGSLFIGDLSDKEQIRSCFRQYPTQAVMHFSAFAYVGESMTQPAKYYQNNVLNTVRLLEVMKEFAVSRFIFSSSCAVYGTPAELPITEGHPRLPISPYGRTKLMVEEILKDFDAAYGMKHISLRYFNAAGADPEGGLGEMHEPETHLIPNILNFLLGRKGRLELFGTDFETPDGTAIRDYIHVTDLAEAHVLALERLAAEGQSDAMNLGTNRPYSVMDIIKKIEEVTGRKVAFSVCPRRPGDVPILLASRDKAAAALGWKLRYSDLETILSTAWAWHRKIIA